MPLQNRVTPQGDFIAVEVRGLFMGNRGGRLHDPVARTLGRRRMVSRRWITCVLDFKGRRREVWGRSYTELFFLDEVTALAAGHRPCVECRRAAANAFRSAYCEGNGLAAATISFDEIDRRLHAERAERREGHLAARRHEADIASLPDGAIIDDGEQTLAVRGGKLLVWTPSGYAAGRVRAQRGTVSVLTPPSTIAALVAGYRPVWHPTAAGLTA